MAEEESSDGLLWPYWIAKLLGIFLGGLLSVIAVMALLGTFLENGWARAAIAVVVVIGVPIFIADRLLPKDDPTKGRGIPTDVLALFLSIVPLLFFGLGGGITADWTRIEGDRLRLGMVPPLGDLAYALSNTDAVEEGSITGPEDAEEGSGDDETDEGSADSADRGAESTEESRDAGAEEAAEEEAAEEEEEEEDDPDVELSSADLFSRWAPSVVSIQAGQGGGTGFIVSRDGVIATNHHVLGESPSGIKVKLHSGTYADEVFFLWSDEELDLALMQITTDERLRPVTLADSETVAVGERAISIGNPLGLEHTLTEGIVSARRVQGGRRMIQMSTPLSPGNSGGPLFRGNGQVIGISTAGMSPWTGAQNLNLAIPVNDLKDPLEESYSDRRRIGGGDAEEGGSW